MEAQILMVVTIVFFIYIGLRLTSPARTTARTLSEHKGEEGIDRCSEDKYMMTKARDLTGFELDFWVGVARGGLPRVVRDDPDFPAGVRRLAFTVEQDIYRSSEGDHFGKSIIKAEKIQMSKPPFVEHWVASMQAKDEQQINATGDTEYQVAMRAYVVSQMGEEVE